MKEWCNNQPKHCEANGDDNSGHCLRVAPPQHTKLATFRLLIQPSSSKRSDVEVVERDRNLSVKVLISSKSKPAIVGYVDYGESDRPTGTSLTSQCRRSRLTGHPRRDNVARCRVAPLVPD